MGISLVNPSLPSDARDVDDFLARADLMVAACDASAPPEANPGVALGLFIGALARSGRAAIPQR